MMPVEPTPSPTPPTFHPSPRRPELILPPGACDAHCHVFGPSDVFPFAPERSFTPSDAPKEKLFALHARLGIQRCVIVQSACHGFDNRVVEDALAAKDGTYLGVALLRTDTPDVELRRLDTFGFRGVRFNYARHLGHGSPIEDVIAFSHRLADIGWHLQIYFESQMLADLAPFMQRAATPVVIDHMGRAIASEGLDQPAFCQLLGLLEDPKFHVKISGSDRVTRQGPPYADAVPFAAKLVAEFGDRVFWGTDWPHPNHPGPVPDDGELVDILAEITPTPSQRQALLVDNPARFYRFPTV